MISSDDKRSLMDLLRAGGGVWEEAEKYREEVRQQCRAAGMSLEQAIEVAWNAMVGKYVRDAILDEIRVTRDEAVAKLREEVESSRSQLRKLAQRGRKAKQAKAKEPPPEPKPEAPKPMTQARRYLIENGLIPPEPDYPEVRPLGQPQGQPQAQNSPRGLLSSSLRR
jgi:polyhydroxyalkanoate synthesis regulator phasin